jgi:flavin reductase (DIM6/NTAB) family NADH-FMN oxidoreductase RutF
VRTRSGVARLTRDAPGPEPVPARGRAERSAPIRPDRPLDAATTSVRYAIDGPRGVARLTPRGAAAQRSARELRDVVGRFATGVTVVTTAHRGVVHGMTANAFLSVSLAPPLVLVSLGRCRMSEMLPRAGRYGISVLAADQEHLARHFAGQAQASAAPAFVTHDELPMLDGALAHIGCRIVDLHRAGDHVLWIGQVEHLWCREGDPLLFYSGRFGALGDLVPPSPPTPTAAPTPEAP